MIPPLSILLESDDAVRIAGWADALEANDLRVYLGVDELPDGQAIDVVVTDQPGNARKRVRRSTHSAQRGNRTSSPSHEEPGVVSVGSRGGDVQLPADASDRELALACRLLGEAVRLRRRMRRSETVRRALSRRAASDPLTGLPNRLAWQKELKRRSAAARSSRESLTLALIDLDHFREVNTQRGYAAGDQALRQAAQALRGALREGDFVSRWGGDEFAVLVSGLDAESSMRLIESARTAMGRASARPSDAAEPEDVPLTASAGVATSSVGQVELESLLTAADEALRSAKAKGRNRSIGRKVANGKS